MNKLYIAALQVQQGHTGDYYSNLLWMLLFLLFFFVIPLFFGEYLQLLRLSGSVSNLIAYMGRALHQGVLSVVSSIESAVKGDGASLPSRQELENRVRELIEHVIITPSTLETQGLVSKLKHLILLHDRRLEDSVRRLVAAEKTIVQNIASSIEALRALNYLYKVVVHYYRLALRYKNPYILAQIYIAMPQIKEYVNALSGAVQAFTKGQPIGDSVGPLVAYKFLKEKCESVEEIKHSVENTYIAKCSYKGRTVYVVKAAGPGSSVGRLDDAIVYLVERCGVKPRLILTVDAALKLEGEKTGTITEGIGVAIGGIGVEKFNIETIAARYGINVYAILIKMGIPEALTVMTKDIAAAANRAVERVCNVIEEYVREGEEAILIGVGNTVGVGQ